MTILLAQDWSMKNINLLNEYFQLLESPKGIESKIIGNCRGKI